MIGHSSGKRVRSKRRESGAQRTKPRTMKGAKLERKKKAEIKRPGGW